VRRRAARLGVAVVAVVACGLAAGCTVAGAPAAAGSRAGAGLPAGAPFVYVTGEAGTNEISQYASLGSGAPRPLAAAYGDGPASVSEPSNPVYRQYHAYSLCMRAHGAPFWPEPTAVAHGVFDPPYAYVITKRVLAQEHGRGWRAALRHCAALAIQGSPFTAAQMRKLRSQLDKLAACMRRHGIAKSPVRCSVLPAAASRVQAPSSTPVPRSSRPRSRRAGLGHLVRQERNPARQE
jgi:hypothetical protein